MDLRATVGANGGVYVSTTAATPGRFIAIQALTECTFTDIASNNITDLPDGLVLAAGVTIYGMFTTLTLASGTLIAYRGDV
jgi:hypothetical protein